MEDKISEKELNDIRTNISSEIETAVKLALNASPSQLTGLD